MFIEIGDFIIDPSDIRYIQKCGDIEIHISFKSRSSCMTEDIEYDNKEDRDKDWDKIKSCILPI
jgi:hypothetical protein